MREMVGFKPHLVAFENRLKEQDRVTDKVAESLAIKGRAVDEAMRLVPDAIRYALPVRRGRLHQAAQSRHPAPQERFSDRIRLRNFWAGHQYKGISSLWCHRDIGQLFEMQFPTPESFYAMTVSTGSSYAWLRSAQTKVVSSRIRAPDRKRLRYRAYDVPAPRTTHVHLSTARSRQCGAEAPCCPDGPTGTAGP
jgi:hypothetical protein